MILNGERAAGAAPRTLAPRFLGTAADKVKWASAVLGLQEKSGVGGGRLSPRRGPGPTPGKQREGEEVGGAQSTLGSDERPASEVRGPGGPARGTIGLAPAFLLRSVSSRGRQGQARRGGRLGVLVALLTRFLARPCCGLKTCHSTYSPAKAASTTCHRLGGFSSRK